LTAIVTAQVQHMAGMVLFGLIAFFWAFRGLGVAYGALRLPGLKIMLPPWIAIVRASR
jgi:hypothetical protein